MIAKCTVDFDHLSYKLKIYKWGKVFKRALKLQKDIQIKYASDALNNVLEYV